MHTILPFLLAMVATIVLLNMFAIKLKIAYPILLVVAGLLISFVPGLPVLKIDPDLIFFIFLPPLLCEASWSVSLKEMKKWYRMIASFAFLVVFFTALAVAVAANHFIPGFTIALGFLLGGIVSPPDAVSTAAITKFVKIPKATQAILEGESLLNDASSLIIFRFALVAVGTGQFIWQEAATSFLWMVLGGAGIGLLSGWLFVQAHRKLPTDTSSDIALTLVEPYLFYWLAETLHSSGVLAVVAGSIYMSSQRLTFLSSSGRIKAYSVWESFVFILNGVVFLIIGLELPEIVAGIKSSGIPLDEAIGYGVLVTTVLIITRMISSYAALFATMVFRRKSVPHINNRRRRYLMPALLGWTGMRGVVSLAAALAIPVKLNGAMFPQRDLILFITFVAILLTLLLQGLTLPYFIKKSRLFEGIFDEAEEEQARKAMKRGLKQHVYEFLNNRYETEWKGQEIMEKFIHQWEERAKIQDDSWMNDKTKLIFLEMLESQRNYLVTLNNDPKINEEIIRQQLYQIDLEEERLRAI
jgi:CPA1 family monovalent cation:H+ antiporter